MTAVISADVTGSWNNNVSA